MARNYADIDFVNSRIHFSPIEPEDKGLLWVNEGYSPTGGTVDLLKGVVLYNGYISDIDGYRYKADNVNEYCTGDTWLNVENTDVVTFILTESIPEAPIRGGVQGYDKDKKFIRTVLPHQPSTEPFSVDIDVQGVDLIKPNLYFGNVVKYEMMVNITTETVPVLFLYNESSGQWEDVTGIDYSKVIFSRDAPENESTLWVNENYSPTGKIIDLLEGIPLHNSYVSDIDGFRYGTEDDNEWTTGDHWLNVEGADKVTFILTERLPTAPIRGGVQGYDKDRNFIRTVLPHQPTTQPFSIDIDVQGIDLIKPNLYFGKTVKYKMMADISGEKVPVLFSYNQSSGQWEDLSGLKYVFDIQFKQARAITGINIDPEVTGNVTELMYYLYEAKNKLPEYVRNTITSMNIYEKANGIFASSTNELGGLYFNNYYQSASPDRLFVTNLVYHEVSHNVDALAYVRDGTGAVVNSLSRDDTFKPVYDALGFTSPVYEAFAEVMNWYYTYKLGYVDYDYYEDMDIIIPYMERVERSGYKTPLVD